MNGLQSKTLKKKRKCNVGHQNEYNADDRISELGDVLLVSILSLLPLKQAVATSILSRRWQYVWTYMFNLNIEDRHILESQKCKFIRWVTKKHMAPKIDQFRLCFPYPGPQYDCLVRDLIKFAMKKRVQKLELDLTSGNTPISESKYNFPKRLFSLKSIGFESLQTLDFKSVNVSGQVVKLFLSNCPVLERLSIYESETLTRLKVSGQSLALKYLVIQHCHSVGRIEISAVNLLSIYILRCRITNLVLRNVPKLVEVSMINRNHCVMINQLSCCLYRLEILRVSLLSEGVKIGRVISNPILTNLKHLQLQVDVGRRNAFLQLNSLMKAFPYLQRLVLELVYLSTLMQLAFLGRDDYEEYKKPYNFCYNNNLKVVEILGCSCYKRVVHFVLDFIEYAVTLEKIIIDDPCECHPFPIREFMGKYSKTHVIEKLKAKVPSTVEFVYS